MNSLIVYNSHNDLAIYITTTKQRVAIGALLGVTNNLDAWAVEKEHDIYKEKQNRMKITQETKSYLKGK